MEDLDTEVLIELLASLRAKRMQQQGEAYRLRAQLKYFAGELSSHYLFASLLTYPYS